MLLNLANKDDPRETNGTIHSTSIKIKRKSSRINEKDHLLVEIPSSQIEVLLRRMRRILTVTLIFPVPTGLTTHRPRVWSEPPNDNTQFTPEPPRSNNLYSRERADHLDRRLATFDTDKTSQVFSFPNMIWLPVTRHPETYDVRRTTLKCTGQRRSTPISLLIPMPRPCLTSIDGKKMYKKYV